MNRRVRQGAILRLIAERPISTQSELAQALHDEGIDVVQTTVSRDVKELGLRKVRGPGGGLVYSARGAAAPERLRALERELRLFAQRIECNETLVVVGTPPGHANALAQTIDAAEHPKILATLAGDDTILVVPRAGTSPFELRDLLQAHLMEGAA